MTVDYFLEQLRFKAKTKADWLSWRTKLQQAVRQQLSLPENQSHLTEPIQLAYLNLASKITYSYSRCL